MAPARPAPSSARPAGSGDLRGQRPSDGRRRGRPRPPRRSGGGRRRGKRAGALPPLPPAGRAAPRRGGHPPARPPPPRGRSRAVPGGAKPRSPQGPSPKPGGSAAAPARSAADRVNCGRGLSDPCWVLGGCFFFHSLADRGPWRGAHLYMKELQRGERDVRKLK